MTSVIGKVAEDEDINKFERDELTGMAGLIDKLTDCLGFCMSEDGDTLSQWRGYADDGRGMSIGFCHEFLTAITKSNDFIRLQKVVYNLDDQKRRVREIFPKVKQLISEGAVSIPSPGSYLAPKSDDQLQAEMKQYRSKNSELFGTLTDLQSIWFSFKNPAFREENEWRLAMNVLKPLNILASDETDYRTADGRLVPYQRIAFPAPESAAKVIEQVILGPKSTTPIGVVESFLRRNGFDNVALSVSTASYR
ncbi:DUF2971 domain-containing protein [Rhizobium sp. Pop5]|uniref:DUF2971 domain-containing protein n=1 Tax=Rhizobium sp. Pop5 TaxID=1223565 RepID=UPI0002837311|nr:DUF2971 domain-containing protein [Rhizobium sp. Pop5]EJZ22135.1 hypothetical protein RCCGEPOP_06331 [Rhizobium sp. Pop5]UVD56975.1 DUF2971 domain-containing protein [Rhizobium sp. Pop5]